MTRTVSVASADALASALARAPAGTTILVEPGEYGVLRVLATAGQPFATGVTVAAADPGRPPIFDGLLLRGVSGLDLKGLDFDTSGGDRSVFSAAGSRDVRVWGVDDAAWDRMEQSGLRRMEGPGAGEASLAARAGDGGVILVDTRAELLDALRVARGGDTVLLEGGDYGSLFLGPGRTRTDFAGVTIASADPSDPASFSGLDLREVSGLTLDGLLFDYDAPVGAPTTARPFQLSLSRDVTVRNSVFEGDVARGVNANSDGFPTGTGFVARASRGITFENNEISGFMRGLTAGAGDDMVVRGNDVFGLRMDGMTFTGMQGLLIEDNYIHDFRRSPQAGDHADMIQFWTTGAERPSTDVVIRANVLMSGEGSSTQSIFMANEQVSSGRAGREMFYQRITIEDNVIVNGHANGLVVGETDGLLVRNNTVLHADGDTPDGRDRPVEIPRIDVSQSSLNVTIRDNISSNGNWSAVTGKPGWDVGNNLSVQDQDPRGANYYGQLFVSSTLEAGDGRFLALPGGLIERLGVGAEATRAGDADGLSVQLQVTPVPDDSASVVFDASLTRLDGLGLPTGSIVQWAFGDGGVAEGLKVRYSYADGGVFDVRLRVLTPDGQASESTFELGLQGPDLLSLTSKGFVAYDKGAAIALDADPDVRPTGLLVAGNEVAYRVGRPYVDEIVGADDFQVSFSVDDLTRAGQLFRLQGSLTTGVDREGNLQVRAIGEDGPVTLRSVGANLLDGKEHDVTLSYDDGRLSLEVDGRSVSRAMEPLRGLNGQDLIFGDTANDARFRALLTAFDVTAGAEDFRPNSVSQILTVSSSDEAPALPDLGLASQIVPFA